MKTLDIHNCKPSKNHTALAEMHGDDSLSVGPTDEFYAGCPEIPGYVRAEPGCLLAMNTCVHPHVDHWLPDGDGPLKQCSMFWVLSGTVNFKVDGFKSRIMTSGDWVVFDHRREHMVLANDDWTGAAWQLKPVRKIAARAAKTKGD